MRGVRFALETALDGGVGLTIGEARLRAVSGSDIAARLVLEAALVGPNEGEGSGGKI